MRSVDFERVLATAPRSRSAHFAAHHLAARPSLPAGTRRRAGSTELSTDDAQGCQPPVDQPPVGWWLGLVVPKRHARRAVTRSLIKRQMRAQLASLVAAPGEGAPRPAALRPGLWVLRLKAPFDRTLFRSAASDALRAAVRVELAELLARAAG